MHKTHARTFQERELAALWNEGFTHIYKKLPLGTVMWEFQYASNLIYYEGTGQYSLGHLS